MGNMNYCKFENTLHDLRECWERFDDCDSESEKKARERLVELCKEIAEDAEDAMV